ncbi:LysR substrate-binding domain-containing protein [Pedobacter nutrimenti]|uniref:LysR family cyn operon transcriptional activator n=1 Tax=Pedobacter nutrimenti TaxID=1241337 RepID=A0A318UB47_9SPHI|nr:LysR substrate-binding domain-containing protein [Pedobacter nutrimenti]PYF72452.1 LysR family cyn operon transcriptional activator [Pedobacter nutrimenti]
MELRQLNYFVKAAEHLHFTEAAGACFVTQSTLSQQIKQLEEELGMLLFDRIGKHVRLTEAGNVFLKHARQILRDVAKSKEAISELNSLAAGDLKIGVTYAFSSMVLPALTPFSFKYPGIKIYVEYGPPEVLELKLKGAELDIILTFHEESDNEGLEMQPLFSSRIMMVVSKKHPLAALKKITVNELGALDLILPGKGFSSRDYVNEIFRKKNILPRVRIEMNEVNSLLSLVENTSWVTVLNEKAIMTWDSLVAIPIAGKERYKRAFILWQKGVYKKKAATLFIEELSKVL